jgi:hypothetical protein
LGGPRDAGQKWRKTVTEEITSRQTAAQPTSALPTVQQGDTGGAPCASETETGTSQINRYLYENLVSNIDGQIEHWNRKAACQLDADAAQTLRTKAEGLGYALRLLRAFEPEFRELTDAAMRFESEGGPSGSALVREARSPLWSRKIDSNLDRSKEDCT